MRRLAGSSVLGLFLWDVHGNITEANDAFLNMVGYTREELLSGRLRSRDMTPEEYRRLDEKGLRDLAETGACAPFEKEYVRKDGSRVPILLGAIMLEGAQHRGISFVLDLTDRDKVQKALSESEAQREAILEASFLPALFGTSANANGSSKSDTASHFRSASHEPRRKRPVDPAKEALGRKLFHRDLSDLNGRHPIRWVLQTGKSIFLPEITDEMLVSVAWDDEHLKIA